MSFSKFISLIIYLCIFIGFFLILAEMIAYNILEMMDISKLKEHKNWRNYDEQSYHLKLRNLILGIALTLIFSVMFFNYVITDFLHLYFGFF